MRHRAESTSCNPPTLPRPDLGLCTLILTALPRVLARLVFVGLMNTKTWLCCFYVAFILLPACACKPASWSLICKSIIFLLPLRLMGRRGLSPLAPDKLRPCLNVSVWRDLETFYKHTGSRLDLEGDVTISSSCHKCGLCRRTHNYTLTIKTDYDDRNFVTQSLYKDIYCLAI